MSCTPFVCPVDSQNQQEAPCPSSCLNAAFVTLKLNERVGLCSVTALRQQQQQQQQQQHADKSILKIKPQS